MSESTESTESSESSKQGESSDSTLRRGGGLLCGLISAALWIAITGCYVGGWDGVAAITLFPYWAWALLGGLAGYAACRLRSWRRFFVLPLLWMLTTLCFSDNLASLVRMHESQSSEPTRTLRVVTLNCAGRAAAADEITALKPDIVLLQEIPQSDDLARLTREWFGETGSYVCGLDCAILARGTLRKTAERMPVQQMQAVLQLRAGETLLVTSVRLLPPEGRWDLWSRKAWELSADNRRERRHQLEVALQRDAAQAKLLEIFGGDFNAPAGDAVFRQLTGFQDAHRQAGRGWGNTAVNNLPLTRPDQIWLRGLRAVSVRALRTRNSDHRLVLAEIQFPAEH